MLVTAPESATKFTIENGYILAMYMYCVSFDSNGRLGLLYIGDVIDPSEPSGIDMGTCIPITLEDSPAVENSQILGTAIPVCPIDQQEIGPLSTVNDSEPSWHYSPLVAGNSMPGLNSCRNHRLPRGLTFRVSLPTDIDSPTLSGSVLTVKSTKSRWLIMI
jgi:hypothetical protein